MSGTYTAAQVAAHNTESDCWLIIDGRYDSTEWLLDHLEARRSSWAGWQGLLQAVQHSRGTKKKLLKGKYVKKMGTLASAAKL